ncbi:MAG: glycosyltransferase family 2 protein [Chloroflexi bacterium]|nr:glycosyltransferase family 2 protein [Chloroflexota bacterium]
MPSVSIIIPCYNEEKTIAKLLAALAAQEYPRADMEVIISDGRSEDGTLAAIEAFRQAHLDVALRTLVNPGRSIPAALNIAIGAAQGEFIVRLDAHSVPHPGYIANSVRLLQEGRGGNVGGVWEILPGADTWMARGIALAAAHPLGVGDAFYRYTDKAGPVDTVPFGAFRRSLIAEIGGFDETLLANEDYEFNARVRASGRAVYLDPSIRAAYFARPTLAALARQYARYGFWKTRMLARYPATLRWRQALPPLFILGLAGGALAWPWLAALRLLYLGVVVSYGVALLAVGSALAVRQRQWSLFFSVPLAIATMHLAWGGAFLWGAFSLPLARRQH